MADMSRSRLGGVERAIESNPEVLGTSMEAPVVFYHPDLKVYSFLRYKLENYIYGANRKEPIRAEILCRGICSIARGIEGPESVLGEGFRNVGGEK